MSVGDQPIIIKKVKKGGGAGHHGGAWKVAYADFVTAMMAFFLLMWLLNATTEDQRKGLADYFSPNNVLSHSSSGTGEPFGGHTAYDSGALVSDRGAVQITEGKRPPLDDVEEGETQVFTRVRKPGTDTIADPSEQKPDPLAADPLRPGQSPSASGPSAREFRDPTPAEIAAEKERQEKAAFEKAAEEIREAVRSDPALAELGRQLAIDMTPEGLRIQIMDEIKLPMFASGSAAPNERARQLLRKIVPVLQKLPQAVSIDGHTDAAPYAGAGKTNWDLSSERANATRRLMTEGGLAETRIRTVTGHADRDPLLPADPLAPVNRRIAILVLREAHPARPADPGHPAAGQPAPARPAAPRAEPARANPGTTTPAPANAAPPASASPASASTPSAH